MYSGGIFTCIRGNRTSLAWMIWMQHGERIIISRPGKRENEPFDDRADFLGASTDRESRASAFPKDRFFPGENPRKRSVVESKWSIGVATSVVSECVNGIPPPLWRLELPTWVAGRFEDPLAPTLDSATSQSNLLSMWSCEGVISGRPVQISDV